MTIRREFVEEIGHALTDVRLLDVVENLFRWQDQDHHEVVFVFSARFQDAEAYDIPAQRVRDDTRGYTQVIWRQPGTVSPPLYPDGVSQLTAATSPLPGKLSCLIPLGAMGTGLHGYRIAASGQIRRLDRRETLAHTAASVSAGDLTPSTWRAAANRGC